MTARDLEAYYKWWTAEPPKEYQIADGGFLDQEIAPPDEVHPMALPILAAACGVRPSSLLGANVDDRQTEG